MGFRVEVRIDSSIGRHDCDCPSLTCFLSSAGHVNKFCQSSLSSSSGLLKKAGLIDEALFDVESGSSVLRMCTLTSLCPSTFQRCSSEQNHILSTIIAETIEDSTEDVRSIAHSKGFFLKLPICCIDFLSTRISVIQFSPFHSFLRVLCSLWCSLRSARLEELAIRTCTEDTVLCDTRDDDLSAPEARKHVRVQARACGEEVVDPRGSVSASL